MNILRDWINDEVQLSRPVVAFEQDMASGYLLGELLYKLGVMTSMEGLVDKGTPKAMVQNLSVLRQPLLDLGLKFESKLANELMTQKQGAASNLCYQIKIKTQSAAKGGPAARRKEANGVYATTLKTNRAVRTKYDTMQAEHFESLVRKSAQNPKALAEALTLSRYTDFASTSQRRFEELETLQAQADTAATSQRRQLQISRMHDSQRHMADWLADGETKHRENMRRKHDADKSALRFELSVRERKLQAKAQANASGAAEFSAGVDEFERMLNRLANGGADARSHTPSVHIWLTRM